MKGEIIKRRKRVRETMQERKIERKGEKEKEEKWDRHSKRER